MSRLRVCLTHDIDRVRKSFQYVTHDLVRFNWKGLRSLYSSARPYWMFDTMADLEDRYGARSSIFFLHETMPVNPFRPSEWMLAMGRYSMREPEISARIREFDKAGWDIGLHGSYWSYRNIELLKCEKRILEDVLGHEVKGIRQHYLNLDEPETWQLQKSAGFMFDASLGKTRGVGFKDGRTKPYLDLVSGMFVVPLTFMESSLFADAGYEQGKALELAIRYMDQCQENEDPYTILWHQRMFNSDEFPGYRWVYEELLREAVHRNAEFVTCGSLYNEFVQAESLGTEVMQPRGN